MSQSPGSLQTPSSVSKVWRAAPLRYQSLPPVLASFSMPGFYFSTPVLTHKSSRWSSSFIQLTDFIHHLDLFQRLATDIYSSFFFFSITSRIPGFLLFFACCSTALLLFAIAWDSGWVKAVIAICVPVSALYYLQYLVFLAESLARGVWRLCSILVSLIRSTSSMFLTVVRWILTMLE